MNLLFPDVHIRVDATSAPVGLIRELAALIKEHPGQSRVYVSLDTSDGSKQLALKETVEYGPEFFLGAKALLEGCATSRIVDSCPKCGEKTMARDPDSDLGYCFTCGFGGVYGDGGVLL